MTIYNIEIDYTTGGMQPTEDLGSELTDIMLRTLNMAHEFGIDMEHEISKKMAINFERGTRGRLK